MQKNKPEVLAPAGSMDSLVAAVRSGADAVYLGARAFSARRNAANFSEQELAEAVAFCHIRGVKVYLTLNIMLREAELEEALQLTRNAAEAGIDGIIVQDLGLAALIHKAIPDLPLHGSTQTSVHSPSALPLLKKAGFNRVVVAREMSFDEIKELCAVARELSMSVEVFVHGALCMAVSGQCLLSSVLGGRSGNRGLCAGPCRLPFAAPGGTGFDLSLKDLSLFSHIEELTKAGVASLKIEGRMKRPEYVAAATAACRAAVDTGTVPPGLEEALQNVFSRSGFTDGYFTAKTGREMFGIRTREDVVSATDALPKLHEIYRNERQSVPLAGRAVLKIGEPVTLRLSDSIHAVEVSGDTCQTAKNKAADKASVTESLKKLGGTPYYINTLDVTVEDGVFIPGSALNGLRRTAVEEMNRLRAAPIIYKQHPVNTVCADRVCTKRPELIARFDRSEQIPENLDGIAAIMLPLECELPQKLPEGVRWIVDVPRGIVSEKAMLKKLKAFADYGFSEAYCGNLAAIRLAQEAGLTVIGGIGLNTANSQCAATLMDMGVTSITLSAELRMSDAVSLKSPLPKGIFAYGKLPLMLFRNCPVKNGASCAECAQGRSLTDRKGIYFPVRCRAGYSELLNSLPIWLADRLAETAGLDFLILYFTDEDRDTVQSVIGAYSRGGTKPKGDYTRGLYYRTVL